MASKAQIAECLAEAVEGMTKKLASEAIDAVFECIEKSLAGGDRVQIPGFGTFVVTERAERQGRNPQTNKPMTIAASNSVRFKPGKNLKDAVN